MEASSDNIRLKTIPSGRALADEERNIRISAYLNEEHQALIVYVQEAELHKFIAFDGNLGIVAVHTAKTHKRGLKSIMEQLEAYGPDE